MKPTPRQQLTIAGWKTHYQKHYRQPLRKPNATRSSSWWAAHAAPTDRESFIRAARLRHRELESTENQRQAVLAQMGRMRSK